VGTGGCEVDAAARGFLDDAGADLEQAQPERCELGLGQRPDGGNGIANAEYQPIGAGVQNQPDLIGDRALARGAVRGELRLVHLDQVLGLASGTVDVLVEVAGISGERGDDVAGVKAARGGFQAGDDTALALPRFGAVGEAGKGAHPVGPGLGAANLEIVGNDVGQGVQDRVAG